MQAVVDDIVGMFHEQFGKHGELHVGWSPGRVNLIGEYTDLNNGFVLPMAIDVGICVVARRRTKPGVTAYAGAYQQTAEITPQTAEHDDMQSWARYIAGVAVLSQERGCPDSGLDIVVDGNLPNGGGVSSSSALTVATSMAIQSCLDWELDPLSTAKMCQEVEHRFAGVLCGVMDQMACRMGKVDSAVFIDCASFESTSVPIAPGHVELLVVDSGVPRSLHATDYNARRNECAMAVQAIQSLGHAVGDLRSVDAALLSAVEDKLEPMLLKRTRHVVTENERVLAARRALEQEHFDEFGRLMNDSHESLRTDFEVSVDELDRIVSSANESEQVLGARLTGAGFGGNAIVLVRPGAVADVEELIKTRFAERYQRTPRMHRVGSTNEAKGYQFA